MKFLTKVLSMAAAIVLVSNMAHATLSYTCDPSVDAAQAGTCSYLNTVIAPLYNNTFTNINADIYVTMGSTGLGAGEPIYNYNQMSYSTYLTDYTANATASGNALQASGVTSLNTYGTPVYGSATVSVSAALAQALGVPANQTYGFSSSGAQGCTITSAGCYEDVITLTNSPSTFSYRGLGATNNGSQYDFFTTLEHETDEALGTQSCIETQTPPHQENNCAGNVSAGDLFRYQSAGNLINILVPDTQIPTAPGAYFSADGGTTNNLGSGRYFNTLVNGEDYADFNSAITVCQGGSVADSVQDAEGCPGEVNLDFGGPEINMLNGVGFDLAAVPEPMSLALILPGVISLIGLRRRAGKAKAD